VGIPKRITSPTLRHRFATHLLQSGTDSGTVHIFLGHAAVSTTLISLHVMKRPGAGAPSTLDHLSTAKFTQIQIYRLAHQHDHSIKCFMNEVAKLCTRGSGFALITDRSCITSQTRPVGQ
jgi:hypothetical protein